MFDNTYWFGMHKTNFGIIAASRANVSHLHSCKPANRNQGGKTEKKSEHKAQKIEQQTSLQQDTFLQQELAQPLPSQSRVNGFAAPAALLTALDGCAQRQSRKASPPSAPRERLFSLEIRMPMQSPFDSGIVSREHNKCAETSQHRQPYKHRNAFLRISSYP